MRAAELVGCTVYDVDGQRVGTVHDLHFEAGGAPLPDSGEPAYRLTCLECGGAGVGHRFGYGRRDMAGPWPLVGVFRRLARRSLMVDWSDITRLDTRRIDIGRRRDELRPVSEEEA